MNSFFKKILSDVKPNQPEFLILQSINPNANRYRIYRIIIKFDDFQNQYLVQCSWGRLGGRGQSQKKWIENEKSLSRFVQSLLMKRKRNNYGILEKSLNFPPCRALDSLPKTVSVDRQLTLFSNQ